MPNPQTTLSDIDKYIRAFSPEAYDVRYEMLEWSSKDDPVRAIARYEDDEGQNILTSVMKIKCCDEKDEYVIERFFENYLYAKDAVHSVDFFWRRYKQVVKMAKDAKTSLESGNTEGALKLITGIAEWTKP